MLAAGVSVVPSRVRCSFYTPDTVTGPVEISNYSMRGSDKIRAHTQAEIDQKEKKSDSQGASKSGVA